MDVKKPEASLQPWEVTPASSLGSPAGAEPHGEYSHSPFTGCEPWARLPSSPPPGGHCSVLPHDLI